MRKGINSLEGRSEKIAEDNDIGEQTTKAFYETKDEDEGFFTSIFSSLFD